MIAVLAIATLLAQAPAPAPSTPPAMPMRENQAPVRTQPAPFSIPPIAGVDRTFAVAAMQGNNAEMSMAELALRRSHTPEVRSYAQKMIDEHTGLSGALMPDLARVLGAAAPPVPLAPPDQLALLHLASIPDADFDQVYALQAIGDHLAALTAFRTEADNGTDPRLKDGVRAWIPTIQSHLELAIDMTNHIGGGTPFKSH